MQHFSVSSEHCARSDFNKILGLSRNEPGAIGWDARMLPLCYATTLHLKKHSLGKNLFEAFKSKFWKNAVGLKFQLQLNDVVKIDSWPKKNILVLFWLFLSFLRPKNWSFRKKRHLSLVWRFTNKHFLRLRPKNWWWRCVSKLRQLKVSRFENRTPLGLVQCLLYTYRWKYPTSNSTSMYLLGTVCCQHIHRSQI